MFLENGQGLIFYKRRRISSILHDRVPESFENCFCVSMEAN